MTTEEEGQWAKYRTLRAVFPEAAERGRLLTAQTIACDAEARRRVEEAYGVDFCRANYPEAYQDTGRRGIAGLLDNVRRLIPW